MRGALCWPTTGRGEGNWLVMNCPEWGGGRGSGAGAALKEHAAERFGVALIRIKGAAGVRLARRGRERPGRATGWGKEGVLQDKRGSRAAELFNMGAPRQGSFYCPLGLIQSKMNC